MSNPYTEDYYMRGKESGLSNYENYVYLPELTVPLASSIKKLMGMQDGDRVLDVGAARGYLVKAMRIIGLDASGFDVSEWAVNNCDPDVQSHMGLTYDKTPMSFDFITAKDCMEHIPKDQLKEMLRDLFVMMRKAMLIIVPLTEVDGCEYLCPKDELDSTHVNRWTLPTWLKFLENIDRRMVVSGGYWVPGIKQANTAWDGSCGFITIRRM